MAESIDILGGSIPLIYHSSASPAGRQGRIEACGEMAAEINNCTEISNLEQQVFRRTNGLCLFESKQYKNWTMTRSYMDVDSDIFHWAVSEFEHWSMDTRSRSAIYFHDAWHLHQKDMLGTTITGSEEERLQEMVNREVEAMTQQLVVGAKLQCDDYIMTKWAIYRDDRTAIENRIRSGMSGANAFFALFNMSSKKRPWAPPPCCCHGLHRD